MSKMKHIKKYLNERPKIKHLLLLPIRVSAKLIKSDNSLINLLGFTLSIPPWLLFKDKYYDVLISAKNTRISEIRKDKNLKLVPNKLLMNLILNDKKVSFANFEKYISSDTLSINERINLVSRLMTLGKLELARFCLLNLIERSESFLDLPTLMNLLRQAGTINFMLGDNKEANIFWKKCGSLKKICKKPTTPTNYRILGSSWFLAIGHIAMLDYYAKYLKLYGYNKTRVVAIINRNSIKGAELLPLFEKIGFQFLNSESELQDNYNTWATENNAPAWSNLSNAEKASMIDEFWEYDLPDLGIKGFPEATAHIQSKWEAGEKEPLTKLSLEEQMWTEDYLEVLGKPKSAWYVCLHVREPGYHKDWNMLYPTMRDADIDTYKEAIEEITTSGGWVIRMGDPSMKPLPKMHNVIDYAHSKFRSPAADIYIAANCKFLIGTNSGYSIIASIFGVPCLLTNWTPIGWPMWSKKDIIIPKLFYDKIEKKYLDIASIFDNGLAFLQNINQLNENYQLIDNSARDLQLGTKEMLNSLSTSLAPQNKSHISLTDFYTSYNETLKKNGSYLCSKFSNSFMVEHAEIFIPLTVSNEFCHSSYSA